ncbi:MAG: hypothetical protein QOD50_277, partial [Actinomycetota bacterium]|nr:hypothetical protein [Actinomycetota bacterium]
DIGDIKFCRIPGGAIATRFIRDMDAIAGAAATKPGLQGAISYPAPLGPAAFVLHVALLGHLKFGAERGSICPVSI